MKTQRPLARSRGWPGRRPNSRLRVRGKVRAMGRLRVCGLQAGRVHSQQGGPTRSRTEGLTSVVMVHQSISVVMVHQAISYNLSISHGRRSGLVPWGPV